MIWCGTCIMKIIKNATDCIFILHNTLLKPVKTTFKSIGIAKTAVLQLITEIIAGLFIFLHFYVTDCNYEINRLQRN